MKKYISGGLVIFSILFLSSGCENNGGYYRPTQQHNSNIGKSNIQAVQVIGKPKPTISSADQKKIKEMELKAKLSESKTQKEIEELKLNQKKLELEAKKELAKLEKEKAKEIAKIEKEKELELQKLKSNSETYKVNVQKEIDLKENVFKIKQLDNDLYLTIAIIVLSVLAFVALIYIVYKIYKKSQDTKVQMHKEQMEHEKEIKEKELQMEVVGKIVDKLSDKSLTRGDKDKLLMAISTVSGNQHDPNQAIEYKTNKKKSIKEDEDIIDVKDIKEDNKKKDN